MSVMTQTLVKISFECDPEGLSRGSPERLWAKPVSSDSKATYFELQNSPFYAKGVSYLDIVDAKESAPGAGDWKYSRTHLPSGHSTYRILIDKGRSDFAEWWSKLEAKGCTYEYSDEGSSRLYAVDVPPTANIQDVYRILEDAEKQGVWTFQEGHCGHDVSER
jgi:uncharacterized protein DUF4265